MPKTREEHIIYTRNELNNSEYYNKVINVLIENKIESFIDIGANVGEFSKILSSKIKTINKGFLFEPESDNFSFLNNNVKDNNFKCYNYAIGYNFKNPILNKNENVGGFFISESNKNDNTLIVKTLEELDLPLVDLIKIDVEGCEFNIIENSDYIKKIKWLEIEFHQTPEQVKNNFIPKYVEKHLPNYDIIIFDGDIKNLYGRCLLRKK